ncbi:MAG: peptidoglycan DD-metalloendopeptidase family protein [Lawsonibacter sp.]|nr:peptidoglycan DD-metalloendopeptidase family protein [Lawsonibacter sp.]
MKRQKKLWTGLLAALLAVCLTAALPVYLAPEASAVTQEEIDALKNSAKDLDGQKRELQQQLAAVAADKNRALEQKALLERQIAVLNTQIANIAEQIAMYDQLIAEKTEELARAEEDEARQYDLFCQRVRVMEEEGEVSYWSILFNSSDFADLLDRFIMVEEIIDYDNAVMDQLIAIREQIAVDKAGLELARQGQQEAKEEQEAAKAELKDQEARVEQLIREISAKEEELEKAEAQLKAAAEAMDREIKEKEKALAAQLAKIVSEAGFIWPLKSDKTLTSLFGNRTHPITGKPNNHTGIDIAAGGGTPILSAKSGLVTTSGYNNSYGNYVVVSHGGGQSTLYAHMRSRAVSEGQSVTQGQTLGYVGSTGSSTGNHLHFEVRLNGGRVDPLNYFKGSTLYIRSKGQTVTYVVP